MRRAKEPGVIAPDGVTLPELPENMGWRNPMRGDSFVRDEWQVYQLGRGIRSGMSTEQQPIAYSINDAAKAIGISRADMYNLMGDKKIAGRKIGARTVIAADELRRFVNSRPMYEPGKGVH